MRKSSITRVGENSAKAMKDKTNWNKVSSQAENEINRNASSDNEAPILKNASYKKANKAFSLDPQPVLAFVRRYAHNRTKSITGYGPAN